jgi:hypothetical protein
MAKTARRMPTPIRAWVIFSLACWMAALSPPAVIHLIALKARIQTKVITPKTKRAVTRVDSMSEKTSSLPPEPLGSG